SPSRKWTPVRTPFGSACIPHPENSEIRTVHPAKIATATFFGIYGVRRMIPLGIEGGGERQNVGRTELNAKSTGLAALDGDGNVALGHRKALPECGKDARWRPLRLKRSDAMKLCYLARRGFDGVGWVYSSRAPRPEMLYEPNLRSKVISAR